MTRPEQLPPSYDLPADAQQRMRERLLTKIVSAEAAGRSRRRTWMAPAAVGASVLLAAGGFTAIRAFTGSQATAPSAATGSTGSTGAGTVDRIDCGTFKLAQGEQLPGSAVRCLTGAAAAGEPAHLQETRPTVEGDPITTTYIVDAQGQVRVVFDTRADRFGSGKVHLQSCTGLTQVDGRLVTKGCTESTAGSD
ncbi:hypothetical protein O7626_23260 [Micromonospora sp. WMMD1102]|uniref:hypothetical protein n=1 Tax=Micromonospora sp. WMMD1102 TaxID=3016105 RepID=UPI00241580FF|nr:hypothetical protein [Micromonospora sp. WMMD1102]MDG4788807.1 hypothetical protein [Micromonospora sp. WMMD1102]